MTALLTKNLELFVEADRLSVADGGAVSVFTDLSGNLRHLTAAANPPILRSNALNNKKEVVWDGTKNPLRYTGDISIKCGFIVCRINGDFTDYSGVLTTLTEGILVGNKFWQDRFFPFDYKYFEFRLDDRIYPPTNAPAPVNRYGIIFFRFAQNLKADGVQLGGDRDFAGRKLNGSVALLALYSGYFCESEIRDNYAAIANSYALPLENVFPAQGSKTDAVTLRRRVLYSRSISGAVKARVKDRSRKSFDLKFGSRSQRQLEKSEAFWNDFYLSKTFLYRDYNLYPPVDTIVELPVETDFAYSGSINLFDYSFPVVEADALSPGVIPQMPDALIGNSPSVPTGLVVTTGSAGAPDRLIVSWNASGGAIGYKIWKNGEIFDVGNQGSAIFKSQQYYTEYQVKILAYNLSGESAYTAIETATLYPQSSQPVQDQTLYYTDAAGNQYADAAGNFYTANNFL